MHCDYVRMNIHNTEQFMIPGIAYTMGLYLPFSVLTSHYFNSLESILWHFATIHNFLHKIVIQYLCVWLKLIYLLVIATDLATVVVNSL